MSHKEETLIIQLPFKPQIKVQLEHVSNDVYKVTYDKTLRNLYAHELDRYRFDTATIHMNSVSAYLKGYCVECANEVYVLVEVSTSKIKPSSRQFSVFKLIRPSIDSKYMDIYELEEHIRFSVSTRLHEGDETAYLSQVYISHQNKEKLTAVCVYREGQHINTPLYAEVQKELHLKPEEVYERPSWINRLFPEYILNLRTIV